MSNRHKTGGAESVPPERKLTGEALNSPAELYRNVLDNMLSGYVYFRVVYEDGRPVDLIHEEVNSAYGKLTGLKTVIGRRVTEVMAGVAGSSPEFLEKLLGVAESGVPVRFDWYFPDQGKWFDNSIYQPGEGFVVSIIDNITDRKLAVQALLENEERFSATINASGVGTWDWDVQTGKVVFNDRWFEIVGYGSQEFSPSDIQTRFDLIHPEDLKQLKVCLEKHFSSESAGYEFECRMRHKNGQWLWVLERGKVLTRNEAGSPLRMLGTLTDISVHKQAEAAMQEREVLFRSLFDSYAAVQIILDPETGGIIDANRAAADFYGWSTDELRQMNIREIDARQLQVEEADPDTIKGVQNKKNICQHRRAGGELRDVEVFRTSIEILNHTFLHNIIHDVTDRLRTEKRLKESEARFRSLFEDHSAAMLVIDLDTGRIVDANQAAASFYGWSRQELGRMFIQEINTLPPEEVKNAMDRGRSLHQNQFRFRHRNADGLVRDVDVYSTRIEIDRKEFLYSIIHDVTDKLQTEEKLKESEGLFRGLFEDHSAVMLILDPETGRMVDANHAAADFYGWSREEFRKMNITDINCASPDFVLSDINKWEKQTHRYVLARHKRADGSIRNVEIFAKKVDIKGRSFIYDVIHDVTDRKRLEALLAIRVNLFEKADTLSVEELLQATLDEIERETGSSIGFSHFIAKDQTTLLLQAFSTNTVNRMCRVQAEGAHHPLNIAGVWAEAVRERRTVIHNDYATLENRRGMPEGHAEVRRELVVPVIRGEQVVAVFGIGNKHVDYDDDDAQWVKAVADQAWDIIEKKIAEDEYRRMEEKLHHSQKMELVGQLASGIAHEINNPLNFVQINLTTQQDYFADFLTLLNGYKYFISKHQDFRPSTGSDLQKLRHMEADLEIDTLVQGMNDIFVESQRGIDRIKKIVEGMRSLSYRHAADDKPLSDINRGVVETLSMARGEYRFCADIETNLEELPPVPCIMDQINQVLLNLIVNSAHAIQSQLRSSNGKISIHTWADRKKVYCSIADDGPGIPEGIRSNIFNPFFTTKAARKGTGLGLSISYDIIVNKHNGTIAVDCPKEGGTVFTFTLPLNINEETPETHEKHP
ncbi:MAG: PAS domain S-box protein [Chlorobiaceae bacterium]|nr:PAS domain S-box protein [Chlorobiaceae bacterium]